MNNNVWSDWFLRYIQPLFNENPEEYFEFLKKKQAPFYPNSKIARKFYEKIKNDSRFDTELKQFFSFLYSCGFFKENVICFEEWIEMKNWINPSSNYYEESILEMLEKSDGKELLKEKIRWLPFLERREGY
ncbi:hypothetical protein [Flavobacterium psychrophilum]|uniref:hypothetical protein n=1 Tax=Flavobacterium psychrophilum TaxID=96345 RepID=UPI000B7C518A|nr:hypothetical protein [Flavobacterium psychrophilum]EKT4552040.1 hypothetical protein [Flavobacterium psychrophilum]MCB6232136.1 hypothetical protein [Flavobacterium psychrophilum]SNA80369.1 hypothetical protein FI146_350003 [Flavobacterium psychrophilum]